MVVYALRGCLRCGLHFEVCLVAWMWLACVGMVYDVAWCRFLLFANLCLVYLRLDVWFVLWLLIVLARLFFCFCCFVLDFD